MMQTLIGASVARPTDLQHVDHKSGMTVDQIQHT
jgi:hypothetical protein